MVTAAVCAPILASKSLRMEATFVVDDGLCLGVAALASLELASFLSLASPMSVMAAHVATAAWCRVGPERLVAATKSQRRLFLNVALHVIHRVSHSPSQKLVGVVRTGSYQIVSAMFPHTLARLFNATRLRNGGAFLIDLHRWLRRR